MRKLFVMVAVVLLAGCSGYIDEKDVRVAYEACESNGGLDWIGNTPLAGSSLSQFRCKNGLKSTVSEYKKGVK